MGVAITRERKSSGRTLFWGPICTVNARTSQHRQARPRSGFGHSRILRAPGALLINHHESRLLSTMSLVRTMCRKLTNFIYIKKYTIFYSSFTRKGHCRQKSWLCHLEDYFSRLLATLCFLNSFSFKFRVNQGIYQKVGL